MIHLCGGELVVAAEMDHQDGPPSPEVTGAFCRVPNHDYLDRLSILYLTT